MIIILLTYRLIDDISSETHSPERFRIIGPFSNRREFPRDFQCKDGLVMNPMKKCELWNSQRPELSSSSNFFGFLDLFSN